jgi:hypothetical protein
MYWNRNLFPGLSGGGSGGPTDQLINGLNTVTLSADGNLYFNNGTAIVFGDGSSVGSGSVIAPPGGSAGIYSNSFNQIVFAQNDGAWIQTSVNNGGSLFNNWNFDLSGRLILPSAAIDPASQAGTSIGLSGTIVFPDGSVQTTAYTGGGGGSGASGYSGTSGATGSNGNDGASGYSGLSGYSGAGGGSLNYSDVISISTQADSYWTTYTLTGDLEGIYGNPAITGLSSQTAYGKQFSSGTKTLILDDGPIHTNDTYAIVVEFPSSPNV